MPERKIMNITGLPQEDISLRPPGFRAAIPIEDLDGFQDLLDAIDASERRARAPR